MILISFISFAQKASDTTVTITKTYHLTTVTGVAMDSVVTTSYKKEAEGNKKLVYVMNQPIMNVNWGNTPNNGYYVPQKQKRN